MHQIALPVEIHTVLDSMARCISVRFERQTKSTIHFAFSSVSGKQTHKIPKCMLVVVAVVAASAFPSHFNCFESEEDL